MSTNDLRGFKVDDHNQPGAPEEKTAMPSPAPAGPPSEADAAPGFGTEVSLDDARKIYVKRNYHRFEDAFARCDAAGKFQTSFSIAPFFFGFLWFFYRKMYLEGLGVIVIAIGITFIAELMGLSEGILRAIGFGVSAAIAGSAKGLYWMAVDRKIAKAMEFYPNDPRRALAWLDAKGGVNFWVIIAAIILFVLMVIGIAAMIDSGMMYY